MYSKVPLPIIGFNPPRMIALKTNTRFIIDGDIEKEVWQEAPWSSDFRDIEGDSRPVPAQRTRAKMLWDNENLYIAALLEEKRVWATLTERDCVIFEDNDFEIFIDPYGHTQPYYEFEMNALNTVWDLLLTKPYRDGGMPVDGFDYRGLRSAVKVNGAFNDPSRDSVSWSVEVSIPWKCFFSNGGAVKVPRHGEYWRMNFSRVEWRTEDVDGKTRRVINHETGRPYPEDNWVWSPTGVVNIHYPELWGFVFFQDGENAPDTELPRDEYIKWELRRVYYAQRAYHAEHGKFCNSLNGLDFSGFSITPVIEATSHQFTAQAPGTDGKLWTITDYGLISSN